MEQSASTNTTPPLVEALEVTAQQRRITKQQLADALGITPSYFFQLKSGKRPPNQISDTIIAKCAAFLGVPRVDVLVMTGKLTPSDFYTGTVDDAYNKALRQAIAFIRGDSRWGIYCPAHLLEADADPATQQLIVLLYERATGKVLLGAKLPASELVDMRGPLLVVA